MPCYQVMKCVLKLDAADKDLLVNAMKSVGFRNIVKYSDEHIVANWRYRTVTYKNGDISIEQSQAFKVDEIKRAYSKQVLEAGAKKADFILEWKNPEKTKFSLSQRMF